MNLFSDLVKKHFHYLLDEYNFVVVRESYSPGIMGNAEIILASLSTGVSIVSDRGQVLINMGAIAQPESEWFEFSDVVRVFAGEGESVYPFTKNYTDLESQIAQLAQIMLRYCKPILEGDFSNQKQIKEIEDTRVSEMLNKFSKPRG